MDTDVVDVGVGDVVRFHIGHYEMVGIVNGVNGHAEVLVGEVFTGDSLWELGDTVLVPLGAITEVVRKAA